MRNKKFVSVVVLVDEAGNKRPRSIVYKDREFVIDRVLEMKRCATFKTGGIGERYKVRICGQETYLFCEMERWFVEEKVVMN